MNRQPVFQENIIYKNKWPIQSLQYLINSMQQTRIMDIHICKTSRSDAEECAAVSQAHIIP